MTRLILNLLGPFQAMLDATPLSGFRSAKNQALLAYLALEQRLHPRLTLADLLWPAIAEETARGNLRQALFQLRSVLRTTEQKELPEFLTVTAQTVQFDTTKPQTIDAITFTALYDACTHHAHEHLTRCPACMERYSQIAALYRGEFLQGLYLNDSSGLEEWIGWRRQQFEVQAWHAIDTLARWYEWQGDYGSAQRYAQRLIAIDPLREEAHALLISALASAGQQAEALAQYQRLRRLLQKELAAEPSRELQQLHQEIKQGLSHRTTAAPAVPTAQTAPPPAISSLPTAPTKAMAVPALPPTSLPAGAAGALPPLAPPHNLPAAVNHFIGRHEEQRTLHHLLADPSCRLITLTGPGGMGKTRLALEVARQLSDFGLSGVPKSESEKPKFPDGLWFVELAAVQTGEALALALLRTLGLAPQEKIEPQQQVLDYLQSRRLLLVLDNFEQLVEASPLVAQWLERAPHLKVLVTSRQRLRLQAEHVIGLEGLPTPVPSATADLLADALTYPSVQLFVERARQVWQRFTDDSSNLPAVVTLCQLMEGLPLGLELAAGWVDEISCAALVAAIQQNYAALTSVIRDVPSRQRTLQAVFESSWRLLAAPEQAALARLALIIGDFSAAAAVAVAETEMTTLTTLIHKSLVRTVAEERYQLHGLVRQFAGEKLAADVDMLSARRSFYRYYLALVAAQRDALIGPDPLGAANHLSALLPNIQQAWQWAVADREFALLTETLPALAEFYELHGLYREATQLLQTTLAALPHEQGMHAELTAKTSDAEFYAELHHYMMRFYNLLGEARATVQLGEMALAVAKRSTRRDLLPTLYVRLGAAHYQLGDPQQAIELHEAAVALTASAALDGVAAQRLWANCRFALGDLLIYRQDARGVTLLQEAIQIYRQIGDRRNEAWALNSLGAAAYIARDYAAGRAHLTEARALSVALGDRYREARVLNNLANIYAALNDYPASNDALSVTLQVAEASGNRPSMITALINLGINQIEQGEQAAARTYYERALAFAQSSGLVRIQGVILNNLGDLLRQAGDLATAEGYLHQSLALARQYNERHYETVRLKNLGLILCAQGHDREAYQFFDEALAVAQQIDDQVTASEVRQQLEALAKRVGGETQVAADGE